MLEKVAIEPCDGFAIIRHKRNYNVPGNPHYVQIGMMKEIEGKKVFKKMSLPRYDMSLVKSIQPRFVAEDFDRKIYQECMNTPEGKEIFNNMRKQRTDKTINEFLTLHRRKVKDTIEELAVGDKLTYVKFLINVLKTPAAEPDELRRKPFLTPMGNNPGFADPDLKITVEEIWNEFKKHGLIKKVTSKL